MRAPALAIAGVFLVACKARDAPHPVDAAPSATPSDAPSASATASAGPPRNPSWRVEELALGGSYFGCARYSNGEVWCAGQNHFGQLGKGTRANTPLGHPDAPIEGRARVDGVSDVVRIVAGSYHACALTKDGKVFCWGNGTAGEIGNGETKASLSPAQVSGLDGATALVAGVLNTCAIVKGGAVMCWGFGDSGQLGDGERKDRATPVLVKGLQGVKQVALGLRHSCALTAQRSVVCWGTMGDAKGAPAPVSAFTNVDEIVANQDNLCARTGDTVRCKGHLYPKPTELPALAGTSRLAGGHSMTCGLKGDGTLVCVDAWQGGKVTERAKDVRVVAVGESWECVVGKDERVRCNAALSDRAVLETL